MLTCNKQILLTGYLLLSALIISSCSDPESQRLQHEKQILSGYVDSSVEMQLNKVSEHVYYVNGIAGVATDNEGFISNAGFVVTDDGVVVFDALGTPSLARKLVQRIRSVTDKPIKKLVISHYHADHIYGLQVFKELGAELIAPAGFEEYLDAPMSAERLEERQFSLSPWVNEKTHLVWPDKVNKDESSFELGGVKFTMHVVGSAHSQGDQTMYVEPDKVLFSGDIIFEGRIPFLGNANTRHWLDTLKKMETSHVAALIPGHGPAADDPQQAIVLTRHYLARVREVMLEAVDNLESFDEVYARTDWSEFEDLPAFKAGHRRNAYQVYLSVEQELLDQ